MTYEAERTSEALDESAATPERIFDLAAVRRAEFALAYAGAVTPPEAWQLVRRGAAMVIDVRTAPEFKFVGRVPDSINVEWHGNDLLPRAMFVQSLRRFAQCETRLLFLCRSAVRSHVAAIAAAEAGFTRVYNVLEGFEGQIDATQQRGKINGWRRGRLPWVQD